MVNVRNEIEVERPTFPEISFAVERSYDLHENEIVDYPGDADEILDQWLTFLNLSYGPHLNITGPGVVNLSRIRNNSFFR